MSIVNPVVGTEQLRRWPFQRRPVAPTGTALVFKRSNGDLVEPHGAMLASDVTMRGLREVYTVDIRHHRAVFDTQVPSANISLLFAVSVSYSWRVSGPRVLVQEGIANAPGECQSALLQRMRPICRRIPEHQEQRAEEELNAALGAGMVIAERGLTITAVTVEVRADARIIGHGQEKFDQAGTIELHALRARYFNDLLHSSSQYAVILASDPSKTEEAGRFIERQLENDRRTTMEAMRVLIDGGVGRHGELDDAVVAVVERFNEIMRQPAAIAPESARPAIASSAANGGAAAEDTAE